MPPPPKPNKPVTPKLDPVALQPLNVALAMLSDQLEKLGKNAKGAGEQQQQNNDDDEKRVPLYKRVAQAAQSMNAAVVGLPNALNALTGALQSQVASYVQLYNPAAVERFNRALLDTKASIGEALVPLLEKGTVVIRGIGDTIASLSPPAKLVIGGLVGVGVGFAATTAVMAVLSATMNTATFGLSAAFGAVAGGAVAMGAAMTPLKSVQDAVNRATSLLAPTLDALGNAAYKLFEAGRPVIGVVERIAAAVGRFAAGVAGRFAEQVDRLATAVGPRLYAVGAVVEEAIDRFSEAFESVVASVANVTQPIITDLLGGALKFLATGAAVAATAISTLVEVIANLLGVAGTGPRLPDKSPKNKSEGKAVYNAQTTDQDSFINRMRTAGFGAGAQTLPEKQFEVTSAMLKEVEDIKKLCGEVKDGILDFPNKVNDFILNVIPKLPSSPGEAARMAYDAAKAHLDSLR